MNTAELLEPRGEDNPSGENLEYDPVFVDLELSAQPGDEKQENDKFIEAEERDYSEIVEKALEVMQRSHDIRAAIFYAEAVLHTEGLTGFAKVTAYVRGLLEEYWDTCHPELDADDDDDPTMRINAVQGLGGAKSKEGSEPMIKALRSAALTDSRMFGKLSLRHIEIAEGKATPPPGMKDVPDTHAIGAAFEETKDSNPDFLPETLAAAISARADLKAIDQVFVDRTPGNGPSLEKTIKTLGSIISRLSDSVGSEVDEGVQDEVSDASDGAGPVAAAAGSGGVVGGINSPTDVSNALDRIIAYYRRSEPSSPLPLLLERAKRLVNADFLTIMNDMAPQGVENVNLIGGIEDDD